MYYYTGTVILRMTPKEFWHTTPRKLSALVQVHVDLNTPKDSKSKQMTVDGVPVDKVGKSMPHSKSSSGGVGAPNAFIDQIM